MLKSFPVNGLNQKIATETNQEKISKKSQNNKNNVIKQAVLTEIQEIKQEIFKTETADDELKLLGELLKHLRTTRSMSLLMLCRQIKKLEVQENQVVVHSDDAEISQLISNEKYKKELDEFFKQKGLSFKLHEKKKEVSAIDILAEMLGGKLVVK